MRRLNALYLLAPDAFGLIYGPDEQREIASRVDLLSPPLTRDDVSRAGELLAQADVLFSGWGAPVMDERFLDLCPRLQVVFYGAGAAGHVATPMAFERGILVSSAYVANSIPVAEYALATILFSLKHGWRLSQQMQAQRKFVPRDGAPGCLGRTVGLVSLGTIARILLKLLKPFDLHILAYDPFLTPEEARELNVERVSLEELFRRSHVVSVHTPSLAETQGLIRGRHLASMQQGATFINTARGEVVREAEMIEVLAQRPDLQAVLDVLEKEPADATSAIFDLPNVFLTPHIAGSVGQECRRMARYMIDELKRYLAGQPLQWVITPELAARSIHRSWVAKTRSTAPAVSISINPAILPAKTASQPVPI
jgi:phosphoglycerate dehydrogenase-like enzyme